MGCPSELRPDMAVTEIALCVLKNRGKAIHFKEIFAEVMTVKGINQENPGRLIAQMLTELSIDSRFTHHGNGEWGLREWQLKGNKVLKIRPEAPAAPTRSRSRLRDDDEYEDEELELEEEEEFEREEEEEFEREPEEDEYNDED